MSLVAATVISLSFGLRYLSGLREIFPLSSVSPGSELSRTAAVADAAREPTLKDGSKRMSSPRSFQARKSLVPLRPSETFDTASWRDLVKQGLLTERSSEVFCGTDVERRAYEKTLERVVAILSSETVPEKEPTANSGHSEIDEALQRREAQLKAIVRSYERELEHWDSVEGVAKQSDVVTLQVAEKVEEPDFSAEGVLQSSAEAVRGYILQNDHARRMLKQLECRSRVTECQVRAMAMSVNNRVLSEFEDVRHGGLLPPQPLTNVKTNELKVATLGRGE